MLFISSIQAWVTQPSIVDLGNLLSNKEALVKQMTSNNKQSLSQVEDIFLYKRQNKDITSSLNLKVIISNLKHISSLKEIQKVIIGAKSRGT